MLFTYLTELHGPKHRSRVLMVLGMVQSFGTLSLPILAWLILPRDWEFILFNYLNGELTEFTLILAKTEFFKIVFFYYSSYLANIFIVLWFA